MLKKLKSQLFHPLQKLGELRATPHAVAMGFAAGFFVGFFPLVGLKTLVTLGVATLFRGNRIAAVVGVTIHDLSLPFVPMLLRMEYDIGHWLLSNPHRLPEGHIHPSAQMLEHIMNWKTMLVTGGPMLLGAAVLGLPLAVISYFPVYGIMKVRHSRDAVSSGTTPD
ncbi:MAG: DUF2062 domain-containing protein [Verrucomicrobiae bacterium]|nr:DUF2062 domain-containing protein [Verrucomicrobiae bacterium]